MISIGSKPMPIHDVSLPISESLVVWPGDPELQISQPLHLDRGDGLTVSRLDMSSHTGTHVDAPAHFVPGGAGVDGLDLDLLVGPALVVHALEFDALSAAALESLSIPAGTERLLLRTRNSERWASGQADFWTDYVGMTDDGARWLVGRGVRLVGIDALSVAPFDDLAAPHRTLLGAGLIVVEGLDLSDVAAGTYQLVCLPLRIAGGDGAPARTILIDL
jgi:arylformamidase